MVGRRSDRSPVRQRGSAVIDYNFNFDPIWRNFDLLVGGLLLGLRLAVVALLIGAVIGLFAGYARVSRHAWLRALVWVYVEIIRNTPLLLLIFFVYFGLPELGVYALDKIESFISDARDLCWRLSHRGVPRRPVLDPAASIVEAAKAIGLRPVAAPALRRPSGDVAHHACRRCRNNFISLFKDTSLAAAIAVPELTFRREDQRRDLPRDRGLDRCERPLSGDLLRHRAALIASSSGAMRSSAERHADTRAPSSGTRSGSPRGRFSRASADRQDLRSSSSSSAPSSACWAAVCLLSLWRCAACAG